VRIRGDTCFSGSFFRLPWKIDGLSAAGLKKNMHARLMGVPRARTSLRRNGKCMSEIRTDGAAGLKGERGEEEEEEGGRAPCQKAPL